MRAFIAESHVALKFLEYILYYMFHFDHCLFHLQRRAQLGKYAPADIISLKKEIFDFQISFLASKY